MRMLCLGFDPRGQAVEIRDAQGEAVLTGSLPLSSDEPPDGICCVPDDTGVEC